jgi:hypothetical protein
MENLQQTTVKSTGSTNYGPKGVKTADVKRMKREGLSNTTIAKKCGISTSAVNYHLGKKRKSKTTTEVKVRKSVNAPELSGFEADLFGTVIKLDQIPTSIERVGNRIIIK